MKKCLLVMTLSLIANAAMAQDPAAVRPAASTTAGPTASAPSAALTITANSTPVELARAALAAQGGDKFKNMKSMMLIGTVDLYAPNSTQSLPGKFVMITSGDRVRLDIDARPIM